VRDTLHLSTGSILFPLTRSRISLSITSSGSSAPPYFHGLEFPIGFENGCEPPGSCDLLPSGPLVVFFFSGNYSEVSKEATRFPVPELWIWCVSDSISFNPLVCVLYPISLNNLSLPTAPCSFHRSPLHVLFERFLPRQQFPPSLSVWTGPPSNSGLHASPASVPFRRGASTSQSRFAAIVSR